MKKIESFTQLKRNCEWPKWEREREIEKILAEFEMCGNESIEFCGMEEKEERHIAKEKKVNLLRFTIFLCVLLRTWTLHTYSRMLYNSFVLDLFYVHDKKVYFVISISRLCWAAAVALEKWNNISWCVSRRCRHCCSGVKNEGEQETFKRDEIARDYSHFSSFALRGIELIFLATRHVCEKLFSLVFDKVTMVN